MGINRRLHDQITRGMLNTSIQFYETNTQGRILNRFSKDVGVMDNLVFTVLEMADVSFIIFNPTVS
jgi:ATP-binding cassette, subfamily C (CFTR/MRP), member 4